MSARRSLPTCPTPVFLRYKSGGSEAREAKEAQGQPDAETTGLTRDRDVLKLKKEIRDLQNEWDK